MIDKKKIEDACWDIFHHNFLGAGEDWIEHLDGEREELYKGDQVGEAIQLGIEWAQREFINSLWHDASEEPDRKSYCIGRYKCFSDFVTFRYPIGSSSWEDYVRYSTLHKWCYLSDLLPKEGGEGCTD